MINSLEVRRQFFHIFLGTSIVLLLFFEIFNPKILFMLLLIGSLLSFISRDIKIPGVYWFLKKFERGESLKKFPGKGAIFFIAGCLLAVKLFDKDIALASIMILTFGDSISHLLGTYLGRIKHPLNGLKNLESSIFGSIIGGLMAMFFVNFFWAFSGAFVAMIIEAVGLRMGDNVIDDNILVPLVAGTTIYIIKTGFLFF